MTTESHPTPQSPPPALPIGRRHIHVSSRTTGEIVTAWLWFCPACKNEEFIILDIGASDHPHIQCSFCDSTYCTGGKCL
jgi:hypothetical protein